MCLKISAGIVLASKKATQLNEDLSWPAVLGEHDQSISTTMATTVFKVAKEAVIIKQWAASPSREEGI